MKYPDNAITLKDVSKRFYLQEYKTFKELLPALFTGSKGGEHIWALKNVNLEIKKGEVVGIIGWNGSGKSTLLKLIAGVTRPTAGALRVDGKVSPLIELGAGFHPELTGRENIYLNASILGIPKKVVAQKYREIVDFAELSQFIDTPVKHYSSGMYMRLGFSVAVNVEPDILLIDEILAVGDTAFQEKCLKKMQSFKNKGVTIIFVSHALASVAAFCERTIWVDSGQIKADGTSQEVIKKYQSG